MQSDEDLRQTTERFKSLDNATIAQMMRNQGMNITEEQIDNISKQFETMLGEITEDISPEDLENIEGESANLGSIFSNILGGKDTEPSKESEQKSNTKVKTKPKEKKKHDDKD